MITKHKQDCQECNGRKTNKLTLLYSGESHTEGKCTTKQIKMWSSECIKCGAKDGKQF